MASVPNYAQHLRAIGQALEILKVAHFEIAADGTNYLVQVLAERPEIRSNDGPIGENTVRAIWGVVPARSVSETLDRSLLYAMAKTLNLHYSPDDVARLEQEWLAKRKTSHGIADPTHLSEMLRAAGGYLREKSVYLLRLRREAESLVLQYETESGQATEEKLSPQDLSETRMRMLGMRASRSGVRRGPEPEEF